ncbi:capsule biosynthesis protein [Roseibium aggregatum]|uniref:Capsular biosynthesis protein n=1 Tax=Roseibium aggregatum TaxID=187304 RepID=A0A926S9C1_9HYPH|nr:capsular biosynthesis protein [Roseibium aggregatum]MBD1546669.1 capsular biosynthesis protein [Roseibium aggregatum]
MPGVNDRKEPDRRRVLFLQGPLSPLFRLTGNRIREAGHDVFRINLCAGDWLHWHGPECSSFRGRPSDWPEFIDRFLEENRITDLVLHGDQRVYHRLAIKCAKQQGIQIAVTELGYLRPGWMTLEKNGLSTLSHFPDDPVHVRRIANAVGDVDFTPMFPGSFYLQTVPDVIYNLANVILKPLYPHYERHTIYHPVPEYLRGAIRLLGEKRRNRQADTALAGLVENGTPFFILPLQLEGDFQLRRHSPYASFADVIDLVLSSFAEAAPTAAHLVLKSHPLDVGYENWPKVIGEAAERHRLEGRVHFFDGGNLGALFKHASGMVTLNSTAGLEALQAGLPVKTLVPAHYDIAGLTSRAPLEAFWTRPEKPDPELLEAFLRAIAGTIQVRGSIHNRQGVPVAADNIARRILNHSLNEPDACVDPPPRLERARALGVPL